MGYKKSNIIIMSLGILSIIYFIGLQFFGPMAFSKFWIMLGAILIIVAIAREKNNRRVCERFKGFKKLFYAVISIFMTFFTLLEGIIIYNGIVNDAKKKNHYLLVLGAGIVGRKISTSLEYRLDTALNYLKSNSDVKVIVSGGQGPYEEITEAQAMKEFLVTRGISEERIIKEDKSRNTYENFKFTREKLSSIGDREKNKILIVTNNFHMFRAKMLGKRNKFEVYGLPAPSYPYLIPNFYVREFFGVIKSYLFDK